MLAAGTSGLIVGCVVFIPAAVEWSRHTDYEVGGVLGSVGVYLTGQVLVIVGGRLARGIQGREKPKGNETARYDRLERRLALLEEEHRREVKTLNPEDVEEYETMRGLGFSHDEALYSLHQRRRGRARK